MQQLVRRRLRLPRDALLSRRSVLQHGVLRLEPVRGRGELLLGQRRLLPGQLQRRGLPLELLERSGLCRQRAVLQLLQRRQTLRAVLGGRDCPNGAAHSDCSAGLAPQHAYARLPGMGLAVRLQSPRLFTLLLLALWRSPAAWDATHHPVSRPVQPLVRLPLRRRLLSAKTRVSPMKRPVLSWNTQEAGSANTPRFAPEGGAEFFRPFGWASREQLSAARVVDGDKRGHAHETAQRVIPENLDFAELLFHDVHAGR